VSYCYDCAANVAEARGPNCMLSDDNPPMPQTNKEKQADYRARMALLGMREVRGVYLPPELHAELKRLALKLLAKDLANTVDLLDKPK
jgi:hypothetical protein